jgi:hypothetical protein
MKLRSLVIAVAVLAILSFAAYRGNRPAPVPAADPRVGTPVLGPDTVAKASGLVVSDQGKRVELTRGSDGAWRVTSYYDLPADFDKMSHFVQDLNEAKVERFVTGNPERLARLEFKDSAVILNDSAGKPFWKLTIGKAPDSGNGRFLRFGDEPKAFFSGLHVWLDTDPKSWADAKIPTAQADDVARVEIPFDDGKTVVASRAKKDGPWTAGAPTGQKLVADKVAALVTTLTSLRFSDTVDPKDAGAAEAARHLRTFRLTTFDGKTVMVALGRKPEEKKLKPPAPPTKEEAAAKPAATKAEIKPILPEFDTIPAGPVFAVVSSSDPHAAVNDLMKRRAFQLDDYTSTGLPQKPEELFEPAKAK